MIPTYKPKPAADAPDSDEVPTKSETLDDIGEGYRFVMSGGQGQPIDEIHREIAELLKDVERNLSGN